MNAKEQAKQEARESLLKPYSRYEGGYGIKPGETIYTKLNHVSQSGMMRVIDLYVMRDNAPVRITWSAAKATDSTYNRKHEGLQMGGCGMDMGFAAVYGLSYALFGKGFECTGPNCPANDHSNGDRDYTPHMHSDGGYALKHRWL